MPNQHYFLFADESGNPGMSTRNAVWAFGGVVVAQENVPALEQIWHTWKADICHDPYADLKWRHFFSHSSQNPLREASLPKRTHLAEELVTAIFAERLLRPALVVMHSKWVKSSELLLRSKTGNLKVNDAVCTQPLYTQFAKYLDEHHATGQIVYDKLGGHHLEENRQQHWTHFKETSVQEVRHADLKLIDTQIYFADSDTNPLVQIADCVCGIVSTLGRYNELFLATILQNYGVDLSSESLGVIQLT